MIRRTTLCLLSLAVLAAVAFGATPVATLSSTGTFELRGTAVNTEGVPSWPVMAGDVIGTSASPAALRFTDGSRVTLGQNSRAKVERTEDGLVFRLISGAMRFTLAESASVAFFDNARALPANAGVATSVTSSSANLTTQKTLLRALPPPPPPKSLSSK